MCAYGGAPFELQPPVAGLPTNLRHLAVNLRGVEALRVGVLGRNHLEHAPEATAAQG